MAPSFIPLGELNKLLGEKFKFESWKDYIASLDNGRDALNRTLDTAEAAAKAAGVKAPNIHGHHIVRKTANNQYVKDSQAILKEYGLDPFFGKENLIYAHNSGHSDEYDRFVRDLLQAAKDNGIADGLNADQIKGKLATALQEAGEGFVRYFSAKKRPPGF